MDKGHGRIERRSIEITASPGAYLGADWPGCAQVFRLTRVRQTGAKVETDVVCGITSLAPRCAGAKDLLTVTRGHWGIENGLHGVRDGTLREDACRARKGSAAQVMVIIRNIAIYLLNRGGYRSTAAATRHYVCQPHETLEIVSTPI